MAKYRGVEGGTVTGPPLCRTCQFAVYIKGHSVSDVQLYCRMIPMESGMAREAYECSMYADKRMPSLELMHKTGWVLRTDEFKKVIGFVSPAEWRKKFRKEDEDTPMEWPSQP
jgi:hypothetical protein